MAITAQNIHFQIRLGSTTVCLTHIGAKLAFVRTSQPFMSKVSLIDQNGRESFTKVENVT